MLCRGKTFGEHPQELKINGSKDIQIAHFLQSPDIRVYDKGNMQTVITFQNVRRHDSLQAAFFFLFTHAGDLLNAKGDLFIEGSDSFYFKLPNASMKSMSSSINAVCTHHSYEIIGGKLIMASRDK